MSAGRGTCSFMGPLDAKRGHTEDPAAPRGYLSAAPSCIEKEALLIWDNTGN